MTIGQEITFKHMAWGTVTGIVRTLHKNGKGGTATVTTASGDTVRGVAFRVNHVIS